MCFLRRPSLHVPHKIIFYIVYLKKRGLSLHVAHTKLYFILLIQRSVGLVNGLVTQFLNKHELNLHNFITYLNLI